MQVTYTHTCTVVFCLSVMHFWMLLLYRYSSLLLMLLVCPLASGENTYKCISCPFSTMTISQLKDHSLREHGETLTLPRLRARVALRTTHTLTHNDAQHTHNDAQHTPGDATTNGMYHLKLNHQIYTNPVF